MKCIVGLGNPGIKYQQTRHNVGFMVIEELLKRHQWTLDKSKFKGHFTLESLHSEKVILLQPQTFMNLSGESIRPLIDFYDIVPEDVTVIYDDLDLPLGKIRLRQKGGPGGGHNGIRSVIDQLGTKEFNRLRFGIGRPETPMSVIDYVLGKFNESDHDTLEQSINHAADAMEAWISQPFQKVMNDYNK
ncbi:peptidyl-tRNA hydrolase [Gracilibacillus boraciitolerans JCM 21714]|uniref:Peptidyl-tRNA hydrolase n=1 Tax=Gracilibacillus boraciitolerans JCM 21714 TaxID=1298598 RepID=W4VLC0_9BACI|nr:aminoacyl-tRNA hydrolase [Gracilibacillus boraciitolerans]GAE94185.1 peptidyl-tRNA hydrolase [Gracilibacillus boraciitolerans JCM 21714]